MSSASPTVAAVAPACQPAMQNSQLPADGTPDPPPTDVEEFSAITLDCKAGGTGPNAAGCANVAAHWLTTTPADMTPCGVPIPPATVTWAATPVTFPGIAPEGVPVPPATVTCAATPVTFPVAAFAPLSGLVTGPGTDGW